MYADIVHDHFMKVGEYSIAAVGASIDSRLCTCPYMMHGVVRLSFFHVLLFLKEDVAYVQVPCSSTACNIGLLSISCIVHAYTYAVPL